MVGLQSVTRVARQFHIHTGLYVDVQFTQTL